VSPLPRHLCPCLSCLYELPCIILKH